MIELRKKLYPRTEMICLSTENTLEENMDIVATEKYTRYLSSKKIKMILSV